MNHKELLQQASVAICVESNGAFIYANRVLINLLGFDSEEKTLGALNADWKGPNGKGISTRKKRKKSEIEEGVPVQYETQVNRSDGSPIFLNVIESPKTWEGEQVSQHVLFDVTHLKALEKKSEANLHLLDTIRMVQSLFIAEATPQDLFDQLLSRVLEITGSEYGFIGEVLIDDEGNRFLKTHALTNIAWSDETRTFYDENAPTGMEFRNLKTLFGEVLLTGKHLISNLPANHPKAGGLPSGHPDLNAFLGVPLFNGTNFVGMAGLANREQGYDEDMLEFLQPLFASCSQLIEAYSNIQKRKKIEFQLLQSENRFRNLVENAADAIYVVNQEGQVIDVNQAGCDALGYSLQEFKNLKVLDFNAGTLEKAVKNWGRRGDEKALMLEGEHTRKDGTVFSVEERVGMFAFEGEDLFLIISRDITERKKVERMKDEFISTISHELRTPLTSIRGALGLLNGGVLGDLGEQAGEMVRVATENSERLMRLINDLLDIQRIESGKIEFIMENMDLNEMIHDSLQASLGLARGNRVGLVYKKRETPAFVWGDKDRLMQLMANLISNAIKFSPPEGQVEIELKEEGEKLKVSIIDHGKGVPKEFNDRIFEKFAQADGAANREKDGSGLGLNISRRIVEEHGGKIGFHSNPGEKTTFFFTLTRQAIRATA